MMPKTTVSDEDVRIGKKIRLKRIEKGLKQGNMARTLNVSVYQYQKYEAGKTRLTIQRLHLISEALESDLSDFLSDTPMIETENITKSPPTVFQRRLPSPFLKESKSPYGTKKQEDLDEILLSIIESMTIPQKEALLIFLKAFLQKD